MEFNTKDFRNKLKADHNIDHIVELQIIVAVLLENKIDESLEIFSIFANYFNKLWNLQFLTKTKNKEKGRNVYKYICYKFNIMNKEPVNMDVHTEISTISSFYNEQRTEVKNHFNSLKPKGTYEKLEKSLFDFLNDKNNQHQISKTDLITKSIELKKTYSNLNNLDHVVELQILTFVLSIQKISSFDLGLKFVKYFHEDWNFQVLKKEVNNQKGIIVKNWKKLVKQNSQSYSEEICSTMKLIFNRYEENKDSVKEKIRQTSGGTEEIQLLKLADDLHELLKSNIPID